MNSFGARWINVLGRRLGYAFTSAAGLLAKLTTGYLLDSAGNNLVDSAGNKFVYFQH